MCYSAGDGTLLSMNLMAAFMINPQGCSRHISGSFSINPLRPTQNGRHFADDTSKRIFLNENVRILIKISLKFAPRGQINNVPALVQIMAWCQPGDKPLSEPMLVSLLTHICIISISKYCSVTVVIPLRCPWDQTHQYRKVNFEFLFWYRYDIDWADSWEIMILV